MGTQIKVEQNLEDFTVIWLDVDINKTKDCIDTKAKLRQQISYLKTFTIADECVDYMTNIQTEKIFLIVSGPMGEMVVPLIYDLPQIHSIYVFCGNKARQSKWIKQYYKISGVYVDKQLLLTKLKEDIKFCSKELLPMSIISPETSDEHSLQDLSNEHLATFMWYHFLIHILLLMPATQTDSAKHEMLEECRLYYKDNPSEMAKIDEFEKDYKSEKAIWWYTSDCFVYRLLNKALRTQDIDAIFKFRFFIADLHKQLCKLYRQYRQLFEPDIPPSLTVYRGQTMSTVDFEKLKKSVGGLISMNTFLSTTLHRELALTYAGSDRSCNSIVKSILFEIQADVNTKSKPFCNINQHSKFDDEEEVLFSIGTIFRVEAVEQIENQIFIVKLVLSGERDQRIEKLTAHLKKQIGKSPTLLTLGWFLYRQGEYDKSERFYQMLLKQLPSNHGDIGTIYNNLGLLYKDKGNYEEALQYYTLALEAYSRTRDEYHPQIGATYNNMSAAYLSLFNRSMANMCLNKAIEIYSHSLKPDHLLLAPVYNQIGQIHHLNRDYEAALVNHTKALEIKLTSLPSDHCSVGTTYSQMGAAYKEKGDLRKSLDYYTKALAVSTTSLPPTHPDLAKRHNDIGLVHLKNGNLQSALTNFQTAYNIGLSTLRPHHHDMIEYKKNIETTKMRFSDTKLMKK